MYFFLCVGCTRAINLRIGVESCPHFIFLFDFLFEELGQPEFKMTVSLVKKNLLFSSRYIFSELSFL